MLQRGRENFRKGRHGTKMVGKHWIIAYRGHYKSEPKLLGK